MRIWRTVKKYLLVYILLVTVFTLSLTIVSSLSSDNIRNNIRKSLPLLEQEGDYPLVGGEQKTYQLDNYTDSAMLNFIYNIDSTKPFEAALRNVIYVLGSLPGVDVPRVQSLKAQIENNAPGNGYFPRYWQGYMVIIRPLLTFATYSDIRKIYELVFFLLFSIITSLLFKKISMAAALAFAASLALINFMIVPFSFSFSSVFFVAFIFMIILLLLPNIDIEKASLLFFIVGACTSFVDLLTAPIVTFGLPAVVVLILRKQLTPKSPIKSDIVFLVCIGLAWVAGYALLWTSKWGLASIVLQKNILADGARAVLARTGGDIPSWLDDGTPLAIHAISSNLNQIFSSGYSKPISWLLLYLIPGLFLLTFIRWHQKIRDLSLSLLLFVLATLPYAWFIFASNHSAIHCWFTYRIQAVTIMAVLCGMYYAINWKNMFLDINKLFRTLKSRGTKSKMHKSEQAAQ